MSRTATDQLPLALDAESPSSPLALRPMLPRAAAQLPLDGRHVFDVSWGGLRVLVHLGGAPRLIAHGRDVASAFPELTEALANAGARGTILDGEVVIPDATGRLDRPALRQRLGLSDRSGAAAALVVSDLPWLAGTPLLAQTLSARRARLADLRLDRPHLVVLAPEGDGGPRILAAARARGLAAVVAKRLDSPYLPGVRSRLWRSVRVETAAAAMPDGAHGHDDDELRATLLALLQPLPLPLGMDG